MDIVFPTILNLIIFVLAVYMFSPMRRVITAVVIVAPFLLSAPFASAQESIKIGRSQLSLPDTARWVVEDVNMPAVSYTGDVSGSIPMQSKRMQYRSVDDLTKLVLTTSITKGAVNAQMSWDNTCLNIEANENILLKDNGSGTRLDCLVVIKVPSLLPFAKEVDAQKVLFNGVLPHTIGGYYIQYSLGLTNGAQTTSFMVIAEGMRGLSGDPVTNSTKVPDSIVRWAIAFAKANNSALTSFSGDWALPALSFN
jgi:hypothetical protein